MRQRTKNIDFVQIGQKLLTEVRAFGNLFYELNQKKFIVDLGERHSNALQQIWADAFREVGITKDLYEFSKGTGLPIKLKKPFK